MSAKTPSERVRLAVELWEAAYSLQRAAVRLRYPNADEDEIAYRMAAARFGEELARAAYRKG